MKNSEKVIRRYIGVKQTTKRLLAVVGGAAVLLLIISLFQGSQPEPEPVPFNPKSASNGDYCFFDMVGMSTSLCHETVENGSYREVYYYYIAQDAEGIEIIVKIPLQDMSGFISQQLYYGGASLSGEAPEPVRLQGLAAEMKPGSELSRMLAESLGLESEEEFDARFGCLLLNNGTSPKTTGSAKLEGYGILLLMAEFCMFMACLGIVTGTRRSIKSLKKFGRLEEAAEQLAKRDPYDSLVIGDGFVFKKNKGFALCPEAIKDAVCSEDYVNLKTALDAHPVKLHFAGSSEARRFMYFIPLECVRDDDVMIKTSTPEKYEDYIGYEY